MLQVAHRAWNASWYLARSLNGVISGEHGIGITKPEFYGRKKKSKISVPTNCASIQKGVLTKGKLLNLPGFRR